MDEGIEAALMRAGQQVEALQRQIELLKASNKMIADERDRLRQVWEDTRTQRDELLAHIAGTAPLPQWAADWLKA
jgi:hypothetical protein